MKLQTIIDVIEEFAPLPLQEGYDNSGLQIGDRQAEISACLLALDVTEKVIDEAKRRGCELILSHHPLLFKGLKQVTGASCTERIVEQSIRNGIAIYSAHTNLDSAQNGVSREMARMLQMTDCTPLIPTATDASTGLGVVGNIEPTPAIEFLRKLKKVFDVKAIRYSADTPRLVIRRVALCGGAGAEFIPDAIKAKADIYVTGDVKYHDFTTYSEKIIIADIGHYESELCSRKIFTRLLREKLPELLVHIADSDQNPIATM